MVVLHGEVPVEGALLQDGAVVRKVRGDEVGPPSEAFHGVTWLGASLQGQADRGAARGERGARGDREAHGVLVEIEGGVVGGEARKPGDGDDEGVDEGEGVDGEGGHGVAHAEGHEAP